MKRNMNIGLRLMISYGIVIVLVMAMGLAAIDGMQTLADLNQRIYRHPLAVGNAVRDVRSNIIAMHRTMKDVALAETEEQINAAAAEVDRSEKAVYALFDLIERHFLGEQDYIRVAQKSFRDWKSIRDQVIALARMGKREQSAAITREAGARHVELMNVDILKMINFANAKAAEFNAQTVIAKDRVLTRMGLLFVFTLILCLVIPLTIARNIIQPVKRLTLTAQDLAGGDLGVRTGLDRGDELGLLSRTFDSMAETIQQTQADLEGKVEERTAKLQAANLDLLKEIDERERAEEALDQSEQSYRLLAENMADNVWILSLTDFRFSYISPSVMSIFGFTPEESMNLELSQHMPPEDSEKISALIMEELQRDKDPGVDLDRSRSIEVRQFHKDGSKIWTEVKASFIRDDNGNPTDVLGVTRDISERKRIEFERERLLAELQAALDEVQQLSGFIPICASCKNIRDDEGYWNKIENYISEHSDAQFSHGICPDCAQRLYPGIDPDDTEE